MRIIKATPLRDDIRLMISYERQLQRSAESRGEHYTAASCRRRIDELLDILNAS